MAASSTFDTYDGYLNGHGAADRADPWDMQARGSETGVERESDR
jgi:hypothetical protein